MYEEFCALDRRSLAKIKVYHARELVTDEDLDLIRNGASRAYRSVKKMLRVGELLRGIQQTGGLESLIQNIEDQRGRG